MLHISKRHQDVKDRVSKPKHIVDVVQVVQPFLVVSLEPNPVEVQRVVREEVNNQCDVSNCAGQDHPLGRLLVRFKSRVDPCN